MLYNQALLYEDLGRYADAVKVLTDAISGVKAERRARIQMPFRILYEQLGHTYRDQQNYPAAIQTFEEMAKLSPGLAEAGEYSFNRHLPRKSRHRPRALRWRRKQYDALPRIPS